MKQSPVLTILLWISCLGVVVWLFVLPSLQDALDTQRTLTIERQKLSAVRTAQTDVQAAIDEFIALDRQLKEPITLATPIYPNEHDLAVLLETSAQEGGLLVSKLNVYEDQDADKKNTNIGSVSAVVSAEGTYEALKQFVRLSETSLRIFDIQRILIDQNEPEANTPLRFEVVGKAYFIQEEE